MKYKVQVKMHIKGEDEWRDIHPTDGPPYTFATEDEGKKFIRRWYPTASDEELRVIHV